MKFFKISFVFILAFALLALINCETKVSLKSLKKGTILNYIGSMKKISMLGEKSAFLDCEMSIYPLRKMGRQKVLPVKLTINNITGFAFYAEDKNGIFIYAKQMPQDIEPKKVQGKNYTLKHPLKIGNSWQYSNDKGENLRYSIVKEEEITVPAGSFRCLKLKIVGKKEINGKIENYKGYQWIDSSGITKKEYIEYEERNNLFGRATYKMLLQLSSVSRNTN